MKRYLVISLLVVGLVVLVAAPSSTAKDMKGKFGIGGNIGYAMMDIEGVNDYFDYWEEWTRLNAWTTTSKDYLNLKGSMTYLGEVKYGVASSLLLTGSGGLLSSKGKVTMTHPAPADMAIDVKVSATFFGAGALYVLPLGAENVNVYLGGGADYYTVKYEEDWVIIGTIERRAEGSKIGTRLAGGVEFFLTNDIAIGGNIVYRIAKLEEIETKKDDFLWSAEGDPLTVHTGDPGVSPTEHKNLEIDLGGINAYVTICLYFG